MITYVGREERERRTESKHNTQYFIQVRTKPSACLSSDLVVLHTAIKTQPLESWDLDPFIAKKRLSGPSHRSYMAAAV
jgi:hypothetical protein